MRGSPFNAGFRMGLGTHGTPLTGGIAPMDSHGHKEVTMDHNKNDAIQLLDGRATAAKLGIAVKTLNRWRREGRIPAVNLPDGTYRYCVREIFQALGGMQWRKS
jgi:hypothetical protein